MEHSVELPELRPKRQRRAHPERPAVSEYQPNGSMINPFVTGDNDRHLPDRRRLGSYAHGGSMQPLYLPESPMPGPSKASLSDAAHQQQHQPTGFLSTYEKLNGLSLGQNGKEQYDQHGARAVAPVHPAASAISSDDDNDMAQFITAGGSMPMPGSPASPMSKAQKRWMMGVAIHAAQKQMRKDSRTKLALREEQERQERELEVLRAEVAWLRKSQPVKPGQSRLQELINNYDSLASNAALGSTTSSAQAAVPAACPSTPARPGQSRIPRLAATPKSARPGTDQLGAISPEQETPRARPTRQRGGARR